MTIVLLLCYLGVTIAIALATVRLVRGPSTLDRLLAFDAIALGVVALLIIYSIQTSTSYFVEILLVFSILGYSTVLGYLDYMGYVKRQHGGQEVLDDDVE